MKVIFLHTAEKVKKSTAGRLYTDGAYNNEVWSRYTKISDDITFIAREDSREYTDNTLESHYNIIPESINVVFIKDLFSSALSIFNIRKHIKNGLTIKSLIKKTDTLIIRMDCNEGYIASRYARRYNKPYYVEVVGCAWDSLWNYSLSGKIIAPFRFIKMRMTVKKAQGSLYVTEKFLQSRYPSSGLEVACSDVTLPSNSILRIEKFSQKKRITLGTIGPLDVSYKGQDSLIRAISKLNHKSDIKYEYQLVGGGDKTRLLNIARKHGVEKYIKFIGQISHAEIFKWLDQIDIYAQPSKVEGLPRAIVEALSRGRPTIGSNLGGIPELLPKDVLFNWRRQNSIIKAIEYASNSQNASLLSQKGLETAKNFNKDSLLKKRNSFYSQIEKDFSQKK